MLEFIAKYWLEFVFGLIAAGIIAFFKYFYKLKNQQIEKEHEEFKESILEVIEDKIVAQGQRTEEEDKKLEQEISLLKQSQESIKAGLLSMQGREFKMECQLLLEKDHKITTEEFDDITKDHDAYKGLGGNHRGDMLYDSVKEKYWAGIRKNGEDTN